MIKKKYKGRVMYELTGEECEQLLDEAKVALVNTYPERNKGYSVALMTSKGNIYQGASYGSDTATLTMHSEASALTHAAIHGETDIVAITGPNCHICKQLIWESSLRSGIEVVVVVKDGGKIMQIPISELMPYPWPDKDGNK
jgi:cytidine deaminase